LAALPAALNRLLTFFAVLDAVALVPLTLAHLALAPAAILARAAADLRRFFRPFKANGDGIPPPSATRESISP
jgi:hypothetical protein